MLFVVSVSSVTAIDYDSDSDIYTCTMEVSNEEECNKHIGFHDYLKTCAAKMEYTVGEYSDETSSIEINCSFLDSKNVISEYVKKVSAYAIKHILSPIPSAEDNAMLLKEAAESAGENRVEKTVTITFNPDNYGDFSVSDEIKDVISANLNTQLQGAFDYKFSME